MPTPPYWAIRLRRLCRKLIDASDRASLKTSAGSAFGGRADVVVVDDDILAEVNGILTEIEECIKQSTQGHAARKEK